MKKITLLTFLCLFLTVPLVMGQVSLMSPPGSTSNQGEVGTSNRVAISNSNFQFAPAAISHNVDQIDALNDIACAGSSVTDNLITQEFDLDGDFGISDSFTVQAVEIGIGTVNTVNPIPMTINIYSNSGVFPGGVLTLQGSVSTTLTNADDKTILNVAVDATIPPGENLVYEIFIDGDAGGGSDFMRFQTNSLAGSGDLSWLEAAPCGLAVPTQLTGIGLPDNGWIMTVIGNTLVNDCGNAPELIPAGAALPNPSSGPMNPSIASVSDTGLIGTDFTLENIELNIEHTWASDLLIEITSPANNTLTLSAFNGGSTGLDIADDLVFNDSSANDISAWGGGAPAANYQAEGGSLNAFFAGEDVNGNWTIDILDVVNGDIGVLNSYCINFEPILGSPPVIMCPANITVNTDAGVCGGTVNYTDAVAIDPDGDLDTVEQVDPDPNVLMSGDVFPVGTTTVTYRATDMAGNFSECSFDITVVDNEDPVITCNDITVSLDAAGMATVSVGDVASATDNCPTTTLLFGGLSPAALTTTFTTNNGSAGNMFDVMPLNDITVNSFDINNSSGGTVDYEIYYKVGTYVGSETNAGDWTLVGSALGVPGNGQDNSTPLGLNMGLALTAGNVYAFYVADIGPGTHRYVNGGTAGDLWASDANLEIYEGAGKGGLFGSTFSPRNFSGTIVYAVGTPPSATLDFTCADVGVNTVMVTATDESGNTATCMADITIVDDIAPVVVCIGEQLTGPNTVSDSPNLPIVDNTTFSTTINVPDSFTINDLNVDIDITHTWTGDITLTLESPAGTQVIIFDDADGCSGDNIMDTYDDESANPLDCQAGTSDAFPLADYIPSNPLSAFDGEDTAGVWTLFVEDDAGGDTGTLNSWGITYDFDPIVATPLEVDLDANGMATINATDLLLSVDEACGWTATVGAPPAPATLETTFAGGNGLTGGGNMFDINALNEVTIQSFDVNLDNGVTDDVEVYVKTGTWVGFEADPAAWTQIATANVTSAGDGLPTPLNLALNYMIPAGETHAFYVTTVSGAINYTNGTTTGAIFASDANIEFLEGGGIPYPFNGLFQPRVFNGNIHYDAGAGISTTIDFTCADLGENLIEVTVTDDSGNVGTCMATVNVNDVTAPILMCMDVTIELDENGEATIDPEALLAQMPSTFEVITISSDNQSGTVGNTDFTVPVTAADSVTFDWLYNTDDGAAFDSFGYLLNGVYTELIDPAGANSQMGSAGPIAVAPGDVFGFRSSSLDGLFGPSTTVISNFQPGFTGQFEPANWTLTLDNSDGDAFFVEIPGGPLSFDACGIDVLGLDIFEVDCDDIANSPITVTVFASDSSGNLASCTSQVTVVDLLAPVVTCPADQTVDPGVGNLFWEVEDYFALGLATATDNCTDPLTIFSQDPAPGTLLSDGVYTITMTSEDEYGNVGTCTFELTVESILGVDDTKLDTGIVIYPNPAQNQVTFSNATNILLDQAVIYDINGRVVSKIDLSDMQQEKTVDVSNLASGVYMVQFQSEDASTVKRLVKE